MIDFVGIDLGEYLSNDIRLIDVKIFLHLFSNTIKSTGVSIMIFHLVCPEVGFDIIRF